MTKTKVIRLNNIPEVTSFVNHVDKEKNLGSFNVTKGSITVDGASLIGMLELVFGYSEATKDLTVEYPDSAIEFDNFISSFVIK